MENKHVEQEPRKIERTCYINFFLNKNFYVCREWDILIFLSEISIFINTVSEIKICSVNNISQAQFNLLLSQLEVWGFVSGRMKYNVCMMFYTVNVDNTSSRTFILVLTTLSRVADNISPADQVLLVGEFICVLSVWCAKVCLANNSFACS